MTTIAVDKNMMAGDRQFTHHSGMKMLGTTKVYEVPLPDLFDAKRAFIGFCGNADMFGPIIGWLHSPEGKPPRMKGVEMLLLTDKGRIMHGTTLHNWLEIKDKHYAIGSGMTFAQAAMACGKSPIEAVKVASKFDPNTGMGFTKLFMGE